MCATRMAKNILLVKTDEGRLYGVTPKKEDEFIEALKERIPFRPDNELLGRDY